MTTDWVEMEGSSSSKVVKFSGIVMAMAFAVVVSKSTLVGRKA